MSSDVALIILRKGLGASNVIIASYQVLGGRRHELNMKWQR